MKKSYTLTVRFPLDAKDDPEARAKAHLLMAMTEPLLREMRVEAKLQEIYEDKPPRKVNL